MKATHNIVEEAQNSLISLLNQFVATEAGLTESQYQRYLSIQYWMTKGVQKHFLQIAAHESLANRRSLRDFLIKFAWEEEPHFEIAHKDLKNSGLELLPCPFDISMWKLYQEEQISSRPFTRLGTTCVLENISGPANSLIEKILTNTKFLGPKNTKFIVIHKHEALPHGDQIFNALAEAKMSSEELDDLSYGAEVGKVMFLRLIKWSLTGNNE